MNNINKKNYYILLDNKYHSNIFSNLLTKYLRIPIILTFNGHLGSGKTTLIRFLLKNLGIKEIIISPTFSIVESYQYKHYIIHHFDLYRIKNITELQNIGFHDFFQRNTMCYIEWSKIAIELLDYIDIDFSLFITDKGRLLKIKTFSKLGINIMCNIRKKIKDQKLIKYLIY